MYAFSAMHALLNAAPTLVLKKAMHWSAINVPVLSRTVQPELDHNAVLGTAPPSVLKLPVD
jgi:hypothetical protein